ncbi:hypothetical protein [Deinococcus petrolearius]|uniref:Uncharacterized protein n=1 Tax=Deinococcus petrolearius TaxID=1751295 RepID=A0ABW1DLA4_9DEIO
MKRTLWIGALLALTLPAQAQDTSAIISHPGLPAYEFFDNFNPNAPFTKMARPCAVSTTAVPPVLTSQAPASPTPPPASPSTTTGTEEPSNRVAQNYRLVATVKELYEALRIDATLSAKYGLFEGNATFSLEQRLGLTGLDLVFVSNATGVSAPEQVRGETNPDILLEYFKTIDPVQLVKLSKSKDYDAMYNAFVRDCGTSFISAKVKASGAYVLVIFRFTSSDQMKRIKADLQAKVSGFGNGTFSMEQLQETVEGMSQVQAEAVSFGGGPLAEAPLLPRPLLLLPQKSTDPVAIEQVRAQNKAALNKFMVDVYDFYKKTIEGLKQQEVIGYQISRYNKLYRPDNAVANLSNVNGERLQLYANQYMALMDIARQLQTVRYIDSGDWLTPGFNAKQRQGIITLYQSQLEDLLKELNAAVDTTVAKARRCVEEPEKVCAGPDTAYWFRKLSSLAFAQYDVPTLSGTSTTTVLPPDPPPFDPRFIFLPRYQVSTARLEQFLKQGVENELRQQQLPIPKIAPPVLRLR